MKTINLCILLLIPSLIISFGEWWENTKAIELTTKNFYDHIGKDKYVLVEFYTPWCKFCKQLSPIYDELVELMAKTRPDISIARIEAEKNADINIKIGVYSFPQLVLFSPYEKEVYLVFHDHGRTVATLSNWLNEYCASPVENNKSTFLESSTVKEENSEDIEKFIESLTPQEESDITNLRKKYISLSNQLIKLEKMYNNLKLESEKSFNVTIQLQRENIHVGEYQVSTKSLIFYFGVFVLLVIAVLIFFNLYRKMIME